jgi:hypothetical protein
MSKFIRRKVLLLRLTERGPFVRRRSKIEDGCPAERRKVDDRFIAHSIEATVFSPLEKGRKKYHAEGLVSYFAANFGMTRCLFRSIGVACACFSGEILMSSFVKGELVICPPRKNQNPEGKAQHAVKGDQAPRSRRPSLRRAFQFSSLLILRGNPAFLDYRLQREVASAFSASCQKFESAFEGKGLCHGRRKNPELNLARASAQKTRMRMPELMPAEANDGVEP